MDTTTTLVLSPLPTSDSFRYDSPIYRPSLLVVSVFDEIRRDLEGDNEYGEFCWFAREYPRCYRHHLSAAVFRLNNIYDRYTAAHAKLSKDLKEETRENFISTAYETRQTHEIYWEFEAFLSSVGSALDLLARIAGTAYKDHLPPSFHKLCKKSHLGGPVKHLRVAQQRWVTRMKRYRDCFVHYTPPNTILTAGTHSLGGSLHVWCGIPANPQARDIIRFRSSKRTDVLRYATHVWSSMLSLDRVIGKDIARMYKAKMFPQKLTHLFHVGRPAEN